MGHRFDFLELLSDLKRYSADKQLLKTVENHPVHITDKNGEFSISSFIPFCTFGGKLIGTKVDGFDMLVCNIFKPKLNHDQLCYETDLQEFKEREYENIIKQLELGLTLVLDYNEERQQSYFFAKEDKYSEKEELNLNVNKENDNSVSIYLDTISIT